MVDVYWLYLAFLSHVIDPVSVFVVDSHTGRHLQSGQIGTIASTVAWSEVRWAFLLSLFVFALATLVADAVEKVLADQMGRLRPASACNGVSSANELALTAKPSTTSV
jgi:hypothetical protein